MILNESKILIIVLTKVNCSLKSSLQEYLPKSRVHVGVLYFARRFSIVNLSHNRIDFVHVRHDCQKLCGNYVAISFFSALGFPEFSEIQSRRFPRALFVCNRLTCYFNLVNTQRIPITLHCTLL